MAFYERFQVGPLPLWPKDKLAPNQTIWVSSFSWRNLTWDTRQAILNPDGSLKLSSLDDSVSSKRLTKQEINRAHLRIVNEGHSGRTNLNQPRLLWKPNGKK